jgi:hypothetical protein
MIRTSIAVRGFCRFANEATQQPKKGRVGSSKAQLVSSQILAFRLSFSASRMPRRFK